MYRSINCVETRIKKKNKTIKIVLNLEEFFEQKIPGRGVSTLRSLQRGENKVKKLKKVAKMVKLCNKKLMNL